jgi:hypothetical protein
VPGRFARAGVERLAVEAFHIIRKRPLNLGRGIMIARAIALPVWAVLVQLPSPVVAAAPPTMTGVDRSW